MRQSNLLSVLFFCIIGGCDLSGGGGGGGGSTSTSSGGSSTTTTTTGGGDTTTPPCDPATCPAPSGECKEAYCDDMDLCAERDLADGTVTPTQVTGDCKKNICLSGVPTPENDDTDIEDDHQTCTLDSCDAGTVTHDPNVPGTPCAEDSGKLCDDAGHCVECNLDSDCMVPTTVCDPTHVCVLPHCFNMVKDADEGDKDCGGATCPPCTDGRTCNVPSDCENHSCNSGVCGPCNSDDDCDPSRFCSSGVCSPPKPVGQPCSTSAQCQNHQCVDGYCCGSPSCGTCQSCGLPGGQGACNYLNPGQQDDTCNSPGYVCDPTGACKKDYGVSCGSGFECASLRCVDGICCTSLCNGVCKVCNGAQGQCNDVPQNSTDADTCVASGQACDGAGACKKALGEPCPNGNGDCASGKCTGGVCALP